MASGVTYERLPESKRQPGGALKAPTRPQVFEDTRVDSSRWGGLVDAHKQLDLN